MYQNQSESYQKSFTKWRNAEKNRFGYRFVHDSREHTYVDGEGFADEQCRAAELSSLHCCLQFLGGMMLLYFMLEQLSFILLKVLFEKVHINWIYFSRRGDNTIVAADEVYLFCVMRLFLVITLLIVGRMVLKLPYRVIMPVEPQKPDKTAYLASAMLVIVTILRTTDLGLSNIMQKLGVDSFFYVYINASDIYSQITYFVIEMVVFPLLVELLFRGMILQLFRQFGDYFAIFVSAAAQACCYHEISKMMFMFIMSIALSTMVIKTGSIIPAAVMRVVTLNYVFLLNSLSMEKFDYADHLTEVIVSLSVIVISFFVMYLLRVHTKKPFIMEKDSTELDFSTKFKQFVNAPIAIIWLIVTMLSTILAVKFI